MKNCIPLFLHNIKYKNNYNLQFLFYTVFDIEF